MVAEEKINPDYVRSDGTVVETNIHYPTDSSLCYDCYRTVNRIVENAREAGLSPVLKGFRFHAGNGTSNGGRGKTANAKGKNVKFTETSNLGKIRVLLLQAKALENCNPVAPRCCPLFQMAGRLSFLQKTCTLLPWTSQQNSAVKV